MRRDAKASQPHERHETTTHQPPDHPGGSAHPRVTATVDHDLPDILTIALCTILCGGESFYDMQEFGQVRLDWLKTFLRLRHGAPKHDTYNRVFQALDPEHFGDGLARWTQSVRTVLGGEVVALDGQTLRRALNKGEDPRVIVSAWATESGLLLGQRKVKHKSNEITVVPELLRALELAGCTVTADADYVLALKGNQGTAFAEVKSFLDDALAREEKHLITLETIDQAHGRLEVRRYWQTEKLEWFADRQEWEGLKSVGVVEARRTVQGKESVERRYYLSSLKNDVEKFARAVRGHWGRGERVALGAGRSVWRRRQPGPQRLRRRKSGGDPAPCGEPAAPGQNLPTEHQRQAAARRPRPRLPQTHPQKLIGLCTSLNQHLQSPLWRAGQRRMPFVCDCAIGAAQSAASARRTRIL
jgi:predicted transposase YbfD/YdcC